MPGREEDRDMCAVSVVLIARCSLYIIEREVGSAVDSLVESMFDPR
jgi:hypothetical protein